MSEEQGGGGPSSPLAERGQPAAPRVSDWSAWSADEVGDWVAACDGGRLAGYRETFVANCITGRYLQDLVHRDVVGLQQMGIKPLGHCLALLQCITRLLGSPPPPPPAPSLGSGSSSSSSSAAGVKRGAKAPRRSEAKRSRTASEKSSSSSSASAAGEMGGIPKEAPATATTPDQPERCIYKSCEQPRAPGVTRCQTHREQQNEYTRKSRNRSRKEAGQAASASAAPARQPPQRGKQRPREPRRTSKSAEAVIGDMAPDPNGIIAATGSLDDVCTSIINTVAKQYGSNRDVDYERDHTVSAREARDTIPPDGRKERFAMVVVAEPTDEESAMAFFSDSKGVTIRAPNDVVYARWDQDLLDRWFRRSTRWCTLDADPVLVAIVGRRWVSGNHARYLCEWARPVVGVNARRLGDRGAASAAGGGGDQKTTWHAATILCQNARYEVIVKAYDAGLRERALKAVNIFLERMEEAGHGELIDMLGVEARIALYGLGILNKRDDGPPPQSLCTSPPGYGMTTRERLMSVVPPPPVRARTIQVRPRDPDAQRAFDAIMGLGSSSSSSNNNKGATAGAKGDASATPDPMDEVRAQRRAEVERGARAKRLIRREWNRVERRHFLPEVEVDQETDDDDDSDEDENGVPKPKPDPFWAGIERRMRLLGLVE